MIRKTQAVAFVVLALALAPVMAQGKKGEEKKKPDDGKITITQKLTLQAMWVYEIEVTTKGMVQMILATPPKIEKKDGAVFMSQRPFLGKSSFEAAPGKDGKVEIKSGTSKIRHFVDFGQGGDWEITLTFDRKTFSGEYTLNVKAVVTR